MKSMEILATIGGGSGIRTHDTVSRILAFQASAFSHSAIPPQRRARQRVLAGGRTIVAGRSLASVVAPLRRGGIHLACQALGDRGAKPAGASPWRPRPRPRPCKAPAQSTLLTHHGRRRLSAAPRSPRPP